MRIRNLQALKDAPAMQAVTAVYYALLYLSQWFYREARDPHEGIEVEVLERLRRELQTSPQRLSTLDKEGVRELVISTLEDIEREERARGGKMNQERLRAYTSRLYEIAQKKSISDVSPSNRPSKARGRQILKELRLAYPVAS